MRHLVMGVLAMAMVAPLAAHAAPGADDVTRVTAGYSDLNLNRGADARVMLQRLDRAALEACGASEFSFREYQQAVRRSACFRNGLDQAVQALNASKVTRLYDNEAVLALNAK